jgi:hypothetical protein
MPERELMYAYGKYVYVPSKEEKKWLRAFIMIYYVLNWNGLKNECPNDIDHTCFYNFCQDVFGFEDEPIIRKIIEKYVKYNSDWTNFLMRAPI